MIAQKSDIYQYEIEKLSPHIAEEDAELWHAFIKRDIPNGASKIRANTPTDATKWHKVYRKLKKEDQKQQSAAEEQLIASLNQKKADKEARSTQILHTVIPQGKRPVWGGPRDAPSGVQALRNARTTTDKLTILKRQTAHRQSGRTVTQSIPTHELQQKRSVVQEAPKSMVNHYSRNPIVNRPMQQPQITGPRPRPAVFVKGAMSQTERAVNSAIAREREEKERRLRALTGGARPTASPQPTTSRPTLKPTISQPSTSRSSATQSVSSRPSQPTSSRPQPTSSVQPPKSASPPATQRPTSTPSCMMPRKRPAYNPMMPAKKRKT